MAQRDYSAGDVARTCDGYGTSGIFASEVLDPMVDLAVVGDAVHDGEYASSATQVDP